MHKSGPILLPTMSSSYDISPLDSPPKSNVEKKENLLTTSIYSSTKEIFKQLSTLQEMKSPISEANFPALYGHAHELVTKINTLFSACLFPWQFLINEKKEERKENRKNVEVVEEQIRTIYTEMMSLCHEKSKEKQSQVLRTEWSERDLRNLKNKAKELLVNINSFLYNSELPSLILSEFKEKYKYKYYELFCTFDNEELQGLWNKVRPEVENYLKEKVLIKPHSKNFYLIARGHVTTLMGKRAALLDQMKHSSIEKKEIEKNLQRNEIYILDAYQIELLKFTRTLRNIFYNSSDENSEYINALQNIFRHYLGKSFTPTIHYEFFKGIADSIETHYIERHLEPCILKKMKTMLMEWKNEHKQQQPFTYNELVDSHWNKLLKSTSINAEEIRRALDAEAIYFVYSDSMKEEKEEEMVLPYEDISFPDGTTQKVLLLPPKRANHEESENEKNKKINDYILKTEKLISKFLGDEGTLLTNFRQFGWSFLQSQSSQTDQKKGQTLSNKYDDFDHDFKKLKASLAKNILIEGTSKAILEMLIETCDHPQLLAARNQLSPIELCKRVFALYRHKHPDEDRISYELFKSRINVLPLFRVKIDQYLAQADHRSLLDIDEEMFKFFAPVMAKIEEHKPLAEKEEQALKSIEKELEETNSAVIRRYGIKTIAKLLFQFHKVLNQSFLIGTLGTLKFILQHIYPDDKKDLTIFEGLEDISQIFIRFGEKHKIKFEWKISTNLLSKNWVLTGILSIELPSIDENDDEGTRRGETTATFELKRVNKKSESSIDIIIDDKDSIEEEIYRRILRIVHVLKTMGFPLGSFNLNAEISKPTISRNRSELNF